MSKNKGFIKEIPRASNSVKKAENKSFTWSKAVVPPAKTNTALATPHRMREFKAVKQSENNLIQEHQTHVKKRRGES